MRVLVIDTALGASTVGVFGGERCLAARSEIMAKGHAERIGGLVRDVVAAAGPELGGFEALDRIGVTVGPGSFTGLRVGLAFAQGLGAALDIPVIGISTLAALAQSAPDGSGASTRVAAAIDARRGQVYLQRFEDGQPVGPAEALAVGDAIARLRRGDPQVWSLVGSGAPLLIEPGDSGQPDRIMAPMTIVNPAAQALADLTVAADPTAALPTPLYLRAPDATPPTRLPGQPRPANTLS